MQKQSDSGSEMHQRHGERQEEIAHLLEEAASSLRTLGDQMHDIARHLETAAREMDATIGEMAKAG